MVVNDVSSIVSKNRNVSDGKLLPSCKMNLTIAIVFFECAVHLRHERRESMFLCIQEVHFSFP